MRKRRRSPTCSRLHDPDRGEIVLDGARAHGMPLAAYRRCVILVPHAAEIFSASVRDNVRLWDDTIGDDAVQAALRRAGLAETVAGFAHGLDTIVGERGNPLSAGQRQRLALARVFLRTPDVLILDEATSALDTESERCCGTCGG